MNTNQLKKFAQEARKKLIEQVGAKLSFVLTADTVELREKTGQLRQLREELNRTKKDQLIDKVAYTWFNRLMALRFMDANDYQPLGIHIITPKDGYTLPELLDEAKRGNIPEELRLNKQKVYDLLDNRIPSSNPQNEAFRELLIASCNHLNSTFPFLFERINDYTELLLPDDLTSEFSIVTIIRNGMPVDDCKNVEIIGWLYQFYISEENARLISSKKVYDKHELAPASELFTPKWIVQYMVDNTLGQLITEISPTTKITQHLQFYIKPDYINLLPPRNEKRLEEIRFFDPCVGSAHILAYAFDVFYLIYKEQGYDEFEIPELIIKHNLYGTDIDERAAQLSSFVLMMKGRQYYRRFLKKDIIPNIAFFKDFEFDNKFKDAASKGSLIKVKLGDVKRMVINEDSIFADSQKELKRLYEFLGQQYDIVVTNPPYISSDRIDGTFKKYVEENYPESKYDLFGAFILRCLEFCDADGFTAYMSPFVWMFISSFENLRTKIINNHLINNLIQLEYSGFDGATVPICTFTLRKKNIKDAYGSYIRLTDFKGAKYQAPKTLEAIKNPKCGWFYIANQKEFKKITGSPIGSYWLPQRAFEVFNESQPFETNYIIRQGMATGDNKRFIRFWQEVSLNKSNFIATSKDDAWISKKKWFPLDKGGGYVKWFGLNHSVVAFNENSYKILKTMGNKCPSENLYFYNGLTWGKITSGAFSVRYSKVGSIFSDAGMKIVFQDKFPDEFILGFLNSKVCPLFLSCFSETLNFEKGNIAKLPIISSPSELSKNLVNKCISISKEFWDSKEFSWDYQHNEIKRIGSHHFIDLNETYDLYLQYWKNKFFKLHQIEEELNFHFIEIYSLQNALTQNIPVEDITILQDELERKALAKLNKKLIRDPETHEVLNYNEIELPFIPEEIMAQFISYAVGCMFGRYSMNKEGLILANHGETLQDYLHKIGKTEQECSFLPDDDNIIPILDNEWFEDDIVGRFYKFLKVTFGEKNFNKNLAFIEEQIDKDIRKYFIKDFYPDHIKRYKKRPIYWMFSSLNGSFNALIYLHCYTPDTVSNILNKYLKEFIGKLKTRKEHLERVKVSGSPTEKNKAIKEVDGIDKMLVELQEYERDVLYPLATKRIDIDLDDGVLVNYNKFGKAVKEVKGLNDKKTKDKVRKFDWIDTTQIR